MRKEYYVPLGRVDELVGKLTQWSHEEGRVPRVRVLIPAISVGDPIDPDEPQPVAPPSICSVCGRNLP